MKLINLKFSFPFHASLRSFSHSFSNDFRNISFRSTRSFSSKNFKFIQVTEPNELPGAVKIALNRPEIHNAFNEELISEITSIFKNMTTQFPKSRCVILTGNGQSFSAGADLNWMKKMKDYTKEENEKDSHYLFDMFYSIRKCPIPVIGRINGAALGGGSGLVASTDFSLALSSAKFGFTEVKLGLIPAVISPFVIEKIGSGHASRFFLTGERFSAEEAQKIGLVQMVYATEADLDASLQKMIKEITSAGPEAVKQAKELIDKVKNMDFNNSETKIYVASKIASIRTSPEGQDGLNSFLQKKNPSWLQEKK